MALGTRGALARRGGLMAALLLGALAVCLAGCGARPGAAPGSSGSAARGAESTRIRVASLKGPTSLGLLSLMDKASSGEAGGTYDFSIEATPDAILPEVIKGDVDIALIPANAAAVLYGKTGGAVTVLDVNTLGVLSVVTGDAGVTGFSDLAHRTVYLTGKGMVPEYTMNYLLKRAGLADSVSLEFKSQPEEVASALTKDHTAIGILPQPFATAALAKDGALHAPIDLTDVWDGYAGDSGSRLLTGVTIVRTEFLKEHPEAVAEFLSGQEASVRAVSDDPASAAKLAVKSGIIDSEDVARTAIPLCRLVCIEGADMKSALSGYLGVLFEQDPSSIGGKMPGDNFYHMP